MNKLQFYKNYINRANTAYFFLILLVVGLFTQNTFRALPSMGIIGFVLVALVPLGGEKLFSRGNWERNVGATLVNIGFLFGKQLKARFKRLVAHKALAGITIVFFMHVLYASFTESGNLEYLLERTVLKLPFLVLPIGLILMPKISEKKYLALYYIYFICLSVTALDAVASYIIDFDAINESYTRSKVLPVATNHVRYSLMVTLAIFIGVYLFIKRMYLIHKVERIIILGLVVFLVGFLHLLSVRSGLLSFYAILFLGVIYFIIRSGKVMVGLAIIGVLFITPTVSYLVFPPFKSKVEVTITDIKGFDNEYNANFQSLNARIFSYRVALHLTADNPLFGVGIGNMKHACEKEYIKRFPVIESHARILPHNQFLLYSAATGLIGLCLFGFAFYSPIIYGVNWRSPVLLLQYAIVTISFMFEPTLETQLGINFSLVFILLPLYWLKPNIPIDYPNLENGRQA